MTDRAALDAIRARYEALADSPSSSVGDWWQLAEDLIAALDRAEAVVTAARACLNHSCDAEGNECTRLDYALKAALRA